jgi:hypothetical protein
MERVRLRHRQAEELIAQAKERSILREQELKRLRSNSKVIPAEASILGCWQIIEKTFLYNFNPRIYPNQELGDYLTFFRLLTPDNYLYGESISCEESMYIPGRDLQFKLDTLTFDVTGRIVREGVVKYRELPNLGKTQIQHKASGQPLGRYIQLPRLLEATWKDWTMEGKNYSEAGEIEFKAVLIRGNE